MNELTTQIDNIITQSAGQFVNTISQYKWDIIPDSQLQAAKAALTKSDYIMKIAANDTESVHDSLMKAAILGLDLTEGKRQGWLLPRKNQQGKTVIVLQTGYKGVEAIHQRMGVIDRLTIRVVRENDIFTWTGDDQDKPVHQLSEDGSAPNHFASDDKRGPIKGAFSVTHFPDKSIQAMVISIEEIYEKHRNASDSWKSYEAKKKKGDNAFPPPWVTYEKAMVEKTMAYIASKQWPANIRDDGMSSKILETLHEVDISDYSIHYTQKQKETFDRIFAERDSLGYFLFGRRAEIETQAALGNTFKKGEKTKNKQVLRDMGKEGFLLFNNILDALRDNDYGLLAESTDGCLVVTERMLKAELTPEQLTTYEELMEADDGADKTLQTDAGASNPDESAKDIQS
jgi:phage RecT family recombinase